MIYVCGKMPLLSRGHNQHHNGSDRKFCSYVRRKVGLDGVETKPRLFLDLLGTVGRLILMASPRSGLENYEPLFGPASSRSSLKERPRVGK
jgi:hypothetical protein